MKRFLVGILSVALLALAPVCKADIVFNSVPTVGGYVAFAASAGLLGVEDYQADFSLLPYGNNSQTDFILQSFQFVGGVTVANSTMQFQFTESNNVTPVATFNVTLPMAGNFIWTITVPDTIIRREGGLRVSTLGGVTGQWFINNDNPVYGTSPGNPYGVPGSPPRTFAFSLDGVSTVPEPSTGLALLLVGTIGLIGRRRR
ncbi:MAG: PEP-CTERM sorting domain-containing protein [Pirellulaceae bacterium]|jgi:hypothetical protein|nr:PEP-CTERM sorting domain-containing protein [Pirellulaceae bacterium]